MSGITEVNRQNFLISLTGFRKSANLVKLQLGESVRESSNYWHDDYGYDDYSAHKCKRGFPSVLSQPVNGEQTEACGNPTRFFIYSTKEHPL